jgi:hypothetical protein
MKVSWGRCSQYRVYRAAQWHLSRTARDSHTQKSARGCSLTSVANGHVSDWLYVQFLSRASGTLQREALGQSLYSCDGQRSHGSCLELRRTAQVQSGSCTLGCTKTTRATTNVGRIGSTAIPIFTRSAFAPTTQGSFMPHHRLMILLANGLGEKCEILERNWRDIQSGGKRCHYTHRRYHQFQKKPHG